MKTTTKRRTPRPEDIARAIVDHRLNEIRTSLSDALGELEPSEPPFTIQDLESAIFRQHDSKMSDEVASVEAAYVLGVEMGARIGGVR